jgi:type IX secretion system PorP/SprF family membrane protein|tara:strand:+ start:23741 stop:24658 length:918 start_codon:yes stop_codon:yes gene_type:complete
MKTKMRHIVLLMILGASSFSWAQQEPHFTQYFDNTLYTNPAYAGSKGVMNAMLLHREQWVGINGRPRSTTFSIQTPLKYESLGLGVTAVNDVIGPLTQTMLNLDLSYSLRFKGKGKLAFGVKGGANLINLGTTSLTTVQEGDPLFLQNVRNKINPNVGAGIYYHLPRFFVGVSAPKLLEKSYDKLDPESLERRHYYGTIGGVLKLTNLWKLRPTAQVKVTNNAPFSADFSIAGIYNDKFYIGGMYRLDAAAGAFIQYQITDQFKAGFATDFGTQKLRKANDGTFEIMLSYDFLFKKPGIKSPRYF